MNAEGDEDAVLLSLSHSGIVTFAWDSPRTRQAATLEPQAQKTQSGMGEMCYPCPRTFCIPCVRLYIGRGQGAGTPRGARASAVMYSLIETAKENDLNPYAYLVWLLKSMPGMELRDQSVAIDRLLPGCAPAECRNRA